LLSQTQLAPLRYGRIATVELFKPSFEAGAVQVTNAVDPWLESTRFPQPLNLSSEKTGFKPLLFTNSTCTAYIESKNMLFITTERHMFCVLSYDAVKGELVTRAMGDLTDRIGRPTEQGQIGIVDPQCRMIGLHLYDGLFKVIPMDQKGQLREAFNIRLEELQVLDIKFLCATAKPTIAVLYQDTKEARHVKTYEVSLKDKDFTEGPWCQNDVEGGSSLIIPVPAPLGGAILVGETVIVYLNKQQLDSGEGASAGTVIGGGGGGGAAGGGGMIIKAIATKAANIMAYGAVDADGSRYLLSDSTGMLHLLVLVHDHRRVHALKLEPLGHTSIASSLSYLDNGVVYVGSAYGDSQLVRLHAQPIPTAAATPAAPAAIAPAGAGGGGYVEVLESFTNLGPIVDFEVVDLDRHGQGQVVTCSGVHKDGSLRVVRNGIGIHEQATVELPGVKGCWSLRTGDAAMSDTYLVVSFIGETRILAINDDDELAETEFEGFSAEEQTLATCNVDGGYILQVTARGARLIDAAAGALKATWSPPAGAAVSVAAANRTQVLLATTGGSLISLAAGAAAAAGAGAGAGGDDAMDTGGEDDGGGLLREVATAELGREIACLDCSPLADPGAAAAQLCAVGLWSMEVCVLSMPDLRKVSSAPLASAEVIPRAVLLCAFEGTPYLLAGLGDG
jgi:DNA damage-binding protein 1